MICAITKNCVSFDISLTDCYSLLPFLSGQFAEKGWRNSF